MSFIYLYEETHESDGKGTVYVYGYEILNSGRVSKRLTVQQYRAYTVLNKCGVCGKVSTPKKVTYRDGVGSWYLPVFTNRNYVTYIPELFTLCMKCRNRAEQINYQEKLLLENTKLLKQLTTYIYHEKKSKHNN